MRLTRLYRPDLPFMPSAVVPLTPDQAHYVTKVLRLETGAELVLFNAMSGGWRGMLGVTGRHAVVTLQEQVQAPTAPPDIHLLAAPLKKEAWQIVVEKCVELNCAALRPVLTEYTQNPRVNMERAQANLVEAAQQCERTDVPQLLPARKLDAVLAQWDAGRALYAALERHDAASLAMAYDPTRPAALLVGPEGGFSSGEKELLVSKNFVVPVTLGPLVLRAETAALAGLAQMAAKTYEKK